MKKKKELVRLLLAISAAVTISLTVCGTAAGSETTEDSKAEAAAELVGEENAEAAYEKLSSMVTGTVYGEEEVSAYADGNGVYDCSFLEGVSTLEFDGEANRIAGYDAEGNELFSHTYHYVGMEEIRGRKLCVLARLRHCRRL